MKVQGDRIPPKFNRFHYRGNLYATQQMSAGFLKPPLRVVDITHVMKRTRPGRKLVLSMLCDGESIINLHPGEIAYPGRARMEIIAGEKHEHEIMLSVDALPEDIGLAFEPQLLKGMGINVSFNRSLSDMLRGTTEIHHVALLVGKGLDEKGKPHSAAQLIFSKITMSEIATYARGETLNSLSWDICVAATVPHELV